NEHSVSGPEPLLPITRLTSVALPMGRTTGLDIQKANESGPSGVGRKIGAAFAEDAKTVVSMPTEPYPPDTSCSPFHFIRNQNPLRSVLGIVQKSRSV